jgi:hypothetical protein
MVIVVAVGRESQARRTSHRVTQFLPEQSRPVKAIAARVAASGGERSRKPASARAHPIGSAAPVAVNRIAEERVEISEDLLEERISDDPDDAMDRALRSGRLQQWRSPDGVETGFVVAGELEGGVVGCRALSVLTRLDSGDQVTHHRRCLADPQQPTEEAAR